MSTKVKVLSEPVLQHYVWITTPGFGHEWIRMAAITSDGTVFVPALIGGDESVLALDAAMDHIPHIATEEHIYLPVAWMAKHTRAGRLAHKIEMRAREFAKAHPQAFDAPTSEAAPT